MPGEVITRGGLTNDDSPNAMASVLSPLRLETEEADWVLIDADEISITETEPRVDLRRRDIWQDGTNAVKGLPLGAKIGIGVGAGVAVILIIALIICCCRRRRKTKANKRRKHHDIEQSMVRPDALPVGTTPSEIRKPAPVAITPEPEMQPEPLPYWDKSPPQHHSQPGSAQPDAHMRQYHNPSPVEYGVYNAPTPVQNGPWVPPTSPPPGPSQVQAPASHWQPSLPSAVGTQSVAELSSVSALSEPVPPHQQSHFVAELDSTPLPPHGRY